VKRDWTKLKQSFLLRVQYVRADAHFVLARTVLASAADPMVGRARCAEPRKLAKRLVAERMPWTTVLAQMISAGVASLDGPSDRAAGLLRAALQSAEAADMAIHAAAIRHRLGLLVGGEEGLELAQKASDAMTSQGICVPDRFANMMLPGRWRR
jgi:hypothetical protein